MLVRLASSARRKALAPAHLSRAFSTASELPPLPQETGEGKLIDPKDYEYENVEPEPHPALEGLKEYTNASGFKAEITTNLDDQIVPEEPSVFETWGFLPHVGMAAVIGLSKEYILLTEEVTVAALLFGAAATMYSQVADGFLKEANQEHQDRAVTQVTAFDGLHKAMDVAVTEQKKSMQMSEMLAQFQSFKEHVRIKETEFTAFQQKKRATELYLQRLQSIVNRENSDRQAVRSRLLVEAKETVLQRLKDDTSLRKKIVADAAKTLASKSDVSGQTNLVEPLFKTFFNEKLAVLTDQADKPQPFPQDVASRLQSEIDADSRSELDLIGVPKELPETYIPAHTGIFGDLSQSERSSLSPSKASLDEITATRLRQLASRYQPGSAPSSLAGYQ